MDVISGEVTIGKIWARLIDTGRKSASWLGGSLDESLPARRNTASLVADRRYGLNHGETPRCWNTAMLYGSPKWSVPINIVAISEVSG